MEKILGRPSRDKTAAARRRRLIALPMLVGLMAAPIPPQSSPAQARQASELHIDWSHLRPKGQGDDHPVFPGAAMSRAQGETLARNLTGRVVRIEGYVLPIDRDDDLVYEFLLVPWLGACSHAPQPPPNQMVHVIPSAPLRIARAYDFVSVTGPLRPELEKSQLFIMDGPAVLTSGYGIGRADVERKAAPSAQPSTRGPWSFLGK